MHDFLLLLLHPRLDAITLGLDPHIPFQLFLGHRLPEVWVRGGGG